MDFGVFVDAQDSDFSLEHRVDGEDYASWVTRRARLHDGDGERGRFDDGQRTARRRLSSPGNNSSSPLLTTPPELLVLIALNLATAPPNLGPPAALLPLLRTCRALHAVLGFDGNPGLWGRIGRAKFTPGSLAVDRQRNPLLAAAHALREHCHTLQILRAGDPHAAGAGRALVAAYTLFVQDSWGAAPLCASAEGLPAFPEALRPLHATPPSRMEQAKEMGGKNRKQLAWAGARDFALRFVRERLYEGRYGEDAEDSNPSWCVGWPRDTSAGAAALWVLWFFEGWETLRAETEPARRALMALLLPFVVAPFRYPSTLCPPHHYSVPLLPALGAGRDAITVPTLHGAYPIYPLRRGRYNGAADDGDTSRSSEDDGQDGSPSRGARRRSRSSRSRSPASHRQRGSGSARLPAFRQPDSASRRRRSRSRSPPSCRRHSRSQAPRGRDSPPRHSRSRRSPGDHVRSATPRTLLTAPPARLLFFARMQAGGRMGVPPLLARDRAEAGARWRSSGETGPQPIGPTQEDIHEKNARPIVRFERQLAGVPLPLGVAPVRAGGADPDDEEEGADSYAPAGASTSPAVEPAALAAYADARAAAEAELAIPFVGADEEAEAGLEDGEGEGGGNERWAAHAWRARLCRGYGDPSTSTSGAASTSALGAPSSSASTRPPATRRSDERGLEAERGQEREDKRVGRGGAPPGRIGHVYELGSFAGLWAGTMLMPSESSYTALLSAPGGAFPRDGLVRDDFVAAARPVYMRIAEHHSFHPHTPVPPPPPDSTTGEEGMRAGWLPRGARFLPLSATQIEIRVPAASFAPGAAPGSFEAQFGYADTDMGWGVMMGGGVGGQRSEERVYVYESVPEGNVGRRGRAEAHGEGCPGCVRVEDKARWARAGGTDPRHGMAWHHYEYAGRVRPWDGLIGLVMRPRDRSLGLATYFISGHLVGRDTFEGTWQMAAQDVLAPSWGGSVCFARGEE
ncbi:hypothetical protein B0H17DRAFT_1129166 [Mycena rosella]|uniref:F-box domain-containing protein n=2 Tax=Mycena rosella TaxID=1033263 RepID=A0AAD7GPN9_MYCRO|nr:hypothetical protein B0H17DRAFT_1129166 [Mycena rosella]